MRILVIDDQARTDRRATFAATLENRGHEVHYRTALAGNAEDRDWQFVQNYDLISWDNDLGVGVDIVEELGRLFWRNHDLFEELFRDKQHIVHSANEPAAERLVSMFEQIGANVRRVHIGNYGAALQ